MEASRGLAAFLRARRELLKPADVGLPDSERRRVEGLRREEVAMLAGISTEYYLRLEQGRDHQPSNEVLEGLAHALQLDDDASSHLRELARPAPRRRTRSTPERFDPAVQTLIDSWPLTPTFVLNRNMTILASNPMARALSRFFTPGENLLRAAFLEPEMRTLYCDWDKLTTRIVPFVRALLGADPPDRELVELIGELSIGSKRFATLWARYDVKHRTSGPTAFYHPQVGQLDLHYTVLHLPEQRQMIVTYHADPGSPSEESLRLLASLTS
ncbi:MAG TPA: helix-turn-helix transcriptional regulator [Mycobacterium sp.]|nr:helix-turn-helix transcriptional regulator [Mycobacterium sp.]